MKILSRYVFREFCVPLAYCLVGFVSLYVLFELFGSFSRLMAAKPGAAKTVAYFAGYFAPYFQWVAPACLMLATLYTMWRFCRHSELVAMRASGIGFFAIAKPVLFAAALLAALVAWVNESYVPAHAQWAKQFRAARFDEDRMEASDNIVYRNAAAMRTWNVGAAVAEDATALEDVVVTDDWPAGGRRRTIHSDRAEFLDGKWWFQSPRVAYYSESGEEIASPVPELERLTLRTFPGVDEMPRDFLLQNRDWQFNSVADRRRFLDTHPALSKDTRIGYEYDFWAQLLAPFACLVVTLFAIPAGIATGRQSVFKGIISALALFFAFYALVIGCMALAKKAVLPPTVAAALPYLVFTAVGIRMFWKQR